MNRKAAGFSVAVLVLLAVALVYTGWRMSRPSSCQACGRPLHAHTRTVGMLASGQQELFCCPTCVLTAHRQTGQRISVKEFTDFESDSVLRPEDAHLVEGSNLNLCMQHSLMIDHDKHPLTMDFDRCSPSIFAFATREAAEKFRRQHGGKLLLFRELEMAYRE